MHSLPRFICHQNYFAPDRRLDFQTDIVLCGDQVMIDEKFPLRAERERRNRPGGGSKGDLAA